MHKQAPNPIDVQDFQFKLHCRLKVFSNDVTNTFEKPCQILASASRFGLVFVGTTSPAFKVIQLSNIETITQKENDDTNYKCRIVSLPSIPTHLSVNCDCTKLAVVVVKNECVIAIVYDVSSFLKKDVSVIQEIRLSTSPGVGAVETTWNPTLPNVFTACKSDGTLGVYEFKETGIAINELPAEAQASCMCWSPKGKQIAVGSANGKITQYKPDLKAMKIINAPPLEGSYSVVAIQWISSFQFIAIYKCTSSDAGSTLIVIDAPKTGEVTYTNYEDICYSYGNVRPVQFYTIHEPLWNILVVASSNSMEVGVLGSDKEQWTQWILADSARAELPLSPSKHDTLPVGLTLDKSAVEPIIWGEHSLPPAPFMFVLSHYGVLCCFRMINIKNGVSNICQPPQSLPDVSGLNSFVSSVTVTPKVQVVTPEVPKPTLPPAQPFLTPPKEIPQPPKPVPFVPPTSLFSSSASSTTIFGSASESTINTIKANNSTKTTLSNSEAQQSFLVTPKVSYTNSVISPTTLTSTIQSSETKIDQEETDMLISKLIREECETLEKELKILLHRGKLVKVELGTDGEAVKLVQDSDSIQKFLAEVIETSTVQAAEVHSLKQGLIQTWAWYEDARSRYLQIQDSTLDTLFRIQQLDPVSQRYVVDIQYLTYYLESQLLQAGRVLDEQWEHFQDSCKKISRLKIPTIETIYQTMVRQSAVYQKQKYVLKDISSRIRAQRSKVHGRSLIVSLNNVEQLEKDLIQLQLDPSNILCAQFERVLETQKKLTASKIKKLEKLLSEKEITHISVNKPQLSNTSLHALLNNSAAQVKRVDDTVLGAALSPIIAGKSIAAKPRIVDFVQSTPKTAVTIPARSEKIPEVPKTQEDKTSFDFTTNTKRTFAFSSQSNNVTNENQNKFSTSPSSNIFTTKAETTFSFAPTVTTSTVTSTSQFNFGSVTTSSFTSLFGTTKPTSSTSILSAPVTITTGAEVNKSISSTASSAFVPTTQLAFTFTAKSNPTTPLSSTNLTTKSSGTTFSFISSASDVQQTPTSVKSDAFAIKNLLSPKTALSTLLSESTPNTPTLFKASESSTNTSMTSPKSLTSAFPQSTTAPSTTSAQPKTSEKLMNLFGTTSAFSFSNADTQSSIFSFKTSQENQNSNLSTPTTASIITLVTKTTTQTSIFENTSKPAFSPTGNTSTTPSKSLFSPVMASETSTVSTVAEADSTSAVKSGSLFVTPTATITSIFGNTVSGATTSSANAATTTRSIFGTATTPTTITSMFGNATTTASIFGSANSNIFGTTAASIPSTTENSSTSAPTLNIFSNKLGTDTSLTPIIFGSTTITPTTSSSVFGNSATVSASPVPVTTTTATTSNIFEVKPATTATSIFGGAVVTTATTIFGVAPTTTSIQTQPINTAVATITTTTSPSAFGVPSTTSSIFGAQPTATTASVLSLPLGFGTNTNSVFGQPTTTASLFSGSKPSVYGEPPKTGSGPFGTQSNAFENTSSVFGAAPVFGTPASTSTNIFATASSSTPPFGSSGSMFGNPPTTNTGFAQTPTSSFSFSAAAANIPNTGFPKPAFGFAAPPANTDRAFSFNNLSMGASSTTANTSFGQSATENPFAKTITQDQKPAFAGGSLFGAPSPQTSSIFGGGSSSVFGNSASQTAPNLETPPGFGSNATFGQTPTFGQSTFGSSFGSPQQPAPFSGGGGQSVAQTGFGAFGQSQQKSPGFGAAPVFGGVPSGFGAPPSFGNSPTSFGASPSFGSPGKVFGDSSGATGGFPPATQQSSTFANLATQNTIGFGALAQQSPTLPTSTPFQRESKITG